MRNNEQLIKELKKALTQADGMLYESLKHKIKKLKERKTENQITTSDLLTKTDVEKHIVKEETILKSFKKITINEPTILAAISPLKEYSNSKIFLLNKTLKNDFNCYKVDHEQVTAELYLEIIDVDLDPCRNANTIEVYIDRKKECDINLEKGVGVRIQLKDAVFLELYLAETKMKKSNTTLSNKMNDPYAIVKSLNSQNFTRLGMVLFPCEYFINNQKTLDVDFLDYNHVKIKFELETHDKIKRTNAEILCLNRQRHVLEKKYTYNNAQCTVCKEKIVAFAEAFICTFCKLLSHQECINQIFFCCQNKKRESSEKSRANFNIPHDLVNIISISGTYCDQCGYEIKTGKNVENCTRCKQNFHPECKDFVFNSCGITLELRTQLNKFTEPNKILANHLMNVKNISEFDVYCKIGTGAFSHVYLAKHKNDKQYTALKVIPKNSNFDPFLLEREKTVLDYVTQFNSPFISKLIYFYQDEKNIYFGLEYCSGGDLVSLFSSDDTEMIYNEKLIKQFTVELIVGLFVLHQKNIIYRDLKLDNILLHESGHIKLTDFGLSKPNMNENSVSFTFCGTPAMMAPEVFKQTGYNKTCDFWSLGIIIYEMFHRAQPFSAPTIKKLAEKITGDEIVCTNESMSEEARDFILQLTHKNLGLRLGSGKDGIENIKNHIWFKDVDWEKVIRAENPVYYKPNKIKVDETKRVDIH